MAKGELKIDISTTHGKLVCVLLIAMCGALWKFAILDTHKSISKLWRKYGDVTQEFKKIHKDIGRLEGRHIE
jgi:hypothetical protein